MDVIASSANKKIKLVASLKQKKHRVRLILKSKDDQLLHKLVRNYLDETKQVVDVNMHPIMMEE